MNLLVIWFIAVCSYYFSCDVDVFVHCNNLFYMGRE